MRLHLQATPEEVHRAVEAVRQSRAARGLLDTTLFRAALVLEECGGNIVQHALALDPRRSFQIVVQRIGGFLVLEFRDPGPPFDPTRIPRRQATPEDGDLQGGWGIQLVRQYADRIRYFRDGEENVLRVTVRIAEPPR